jgi:hypothetical protein
MPHALKVGLERLSGMDLTAVRVHRNSSLPALIGALAYTRGGDIHLAPGQDRHLAHEGWHVVQQMQGRVRPTTRAIGLALNADHELESEAERMGARVRARATEAWAGGVDASVAIPAPETKTVAGAPMPGTRVPVVQRAANFTPGRVSPEINLAEHFLAGHAFTGITAPTLNGTAILREPDARLAVDPPMLSQNARPDGTVAVKVAREPTNQASFVTAVPTSGPWSAATEKAKVAFLARKFGLTPPAGCLLPGFTTLTIYGKPTEADFVANAGAHEALHARDHETAFNNVIVPWDAKLQAAQKAGTEFTGATVDEAHARLFAAMGGTPAAIGIAQHNEWVKLNDALHNAGTTVANGGPATASNAAAGPSCTTASFDLT